MFILDHHDTLMPYLRRINSTTTKTYATRTLLFLQRDGTLKPIAIELSLPHPQGDLHGCVSSVFTPAEKGIEGSIWQLAKAYVAVNDSGFHQLISHWYDLPVTLRKQKGKRITCSELSDNMWFCGPENRIYAHELTGR